LKTVAAGAATRYDSSVNPQTRRSTLYTLTDESHERLIAEAETMEAARFAARILHEEGEPLPILIVNDDEVEAYRLVHGPHGPMLTGSSVSASV
jgi:hypothetical protein